MTGLFLCIAVTGLLYFLFAKRQFDFFSVAFFSACVYFLPGFLGYTLMPTRTSMELPVDLEVETYLVMISVLVAIFIGALWFDAVPLSTVPAFRLRGTERSALWATAFAVLGYSLLIGTAGAALFYEDKHKILDMLNRWHVLGATAASFGAVSAFILRRWALFCISTILLLFDLYIGFRFSFAVTAIAIFTLSLSQKNMQRFVMQNWKIGVMGLFIAFSMFVYKPMYEVVKLGMWDFIGERVQDPDLYITAIGMSEPFTIQVILNEVVSQRFTVGIGHLKEALYQFALFSPELGAKPTSFNDLFQPHLFPTAMEYNMANNIWAEMWSSGGWPLLLVFIIIFVLMLALGSYLLRTKEPTLAAGAALMFSYWAFYIHRNDLAFQINLEKRVILVLAICMGLCELSNFLDPSASRSPKTSSSKSIPGTQFSA